MIRFHLLKLNLHNGISSFRTVSKRICSSVTNSFPNFGRQIFDATNFVPTLIQVLTIPLGVGISVVVRPR